MATVEEIFIPATTYSTKNGLPSNDIQDIVQDQQGYIWLASQKGLSRFDSTGFLNFSKDKSNEFSIPDLLIEDMILMPDGNLWMSVNEVGITIFNTFTKKATSIKNQHSALYQLPNNNLYGMAKDMNDNVWFSLFGEGIYQWNLKSKTFTKHLQSNENAWLTSKKTFEILVDSKNRLWVCTIDSMVYVYDINTGASKSFNFSSDVNDPLSSPIYGFAEATNGDIYAGGYSGVFKYNEELREFDSYISEDVLSKHYNGEHTTVRRLMIDSNNNLWIGTVRSLLQFSNDTLYAVKLFENGALLKYNSSTIHTILEAKDGNIWIGTEGLGLIKLAPDWDRFTIYISQDKEVIDLKNAFQFEDKIWLVHPSSRVDLLVHEAGKVTLKNSFMPAVGDGSIRVDSIYQDMPGVLWLSSISGIHKIDLITGTSHMVKNQQGRKLGSVRRFYRAANNKFYFNLFSEKTIGYFDENEMVAHFIENSKENGFLGNSVFEIKQGLDGNIWMASNYGIESLNIESNKFAVVYKSPKQQSINDFYFDGLKGVWIIADGALYYLLWDGQNLQLKGDRFRNVLPKINFNKIKRLQNDVLLITTVDSGFVELNVKTLDYKLYTQENGLPSDNVIDVLFPQGKPVIITESGIAIFNEKYQDNTPKKPRIVIDTIELGDKTIPIKNNNKLVLDYNYGSLSFDVALLSYANSSSIEYEYKLKGANNEWINTGRDDKYNFLNLTDRDYTFQVRGRSNYGIWSNPVEYSFVVEPPAWKTIWAYIIYLILAISLFYWLLYIYKRKILYEHEITKQHAKKDLANAASKAKSDFLARVSHEIRTPLNGVLGMGELMQDTPLNEEQKIYAESIMASGRHLLDIINDILDLSKIEAGKLELEHQPFNLLLLVDEIVEIFTSQTKQKRLVFTCIFDQNIDICRLGDGIRIKQVMFNLLSNAFKFTKQGSITLKISKSKKDNNRVQFVIEDTGIGVDEKVVESLFKPFVQADSAITRKFGGTGLGLAIVKQLVEKMQGSIEARGMINQGSVFSAEMLLQIESQSNNEPQQDLSANNICLQINQTNLKLSLVEYFSRLNIGHSEEMESNTTCVFVDCIGKISAQQRAIIHAAAQIGIEIYFIVFSIEDIDKSLIAQATSFRVLTLPITFQKIKKAFSLEDTDQVIEGLSSIASISFDALKILVVEDNSINQQVSIEMLERMGHLVDIVDNAEEALTMLSRNKYNVLLLDYHLPGMDGLSLVRTWGNPNNIPIIVVTADLTDAVFQKCHKLNLKNIVTKPFTQESLASAIQKAFE